MKLNYKSIKDRLKFFFIKIKIILNFLKDNNIGANPEAHKGLKTLISRFDEELPFDIEELPLERN